MKPKIILSLVIFMSFLPPYTSAFAQERSGDLAVLDIRAGANLPQGLDLDLLGQILREEAVKATGYRVMTRENIFAILQDKGIDLSKCADMECEVQYGRILQADKLLSGKLTLVGTTYYLSLNLYDTPTAAIDKSLTRDCKGCDFSQLLSVVRDSAKELFGAATAPGGLALPFPEEGVAAGPKGGLYIKTEPPGASIVINGNEMKGSTPMTLSDIPVGTYTIESTKGTYSGAARVRVKADEFASIKIVMEPIKARITIVTDPPEAEVLLDGNPIGTSPLTASDVPAGEHTLEARLSGYLPTTQKINVEKVEQKASIALIRGAGITVNSDPTGALVYIDNDYKGTTPLTEALAPGRHKVMVKMDDYVEWERDIVLAMKGAVIDAKLKPTFGLIRLTTKPPGLTAYVDEKNMGVTPVEVKVRSGPHTVVVRKEGTGEEKHASVTVNAGEEKNIDLALKLKPQPSRETQIVRPLSPEDIQRKRKVANIVAYSGMGLAGVGGGLAVTFSVMAQNARKKYEQATSKADLDKYINEVKADNQMVYISYGIMGAGAIISIVSWIVKPSTPEGTRSEDEPGGIRIGFLLNGNLVGVTTTF